MDGKDLVRRVVVPVGGSDAEYYAQEQAVLWADALGVPLHAIHISAEPDRVNDPFAYLEKQCRGHGVELETHVLVGTDAAEELLKEVDALDLTVIGSKRLDGGFRLGSVALRLFREGASPLHIVRLDH